MDTLARILQDNHLHRCLAFRTCRLLVSMYADDILLFVTDPALNLPVLVREIIQFGCFSGLAINWSKSELFPLTAGTGVVDVQFPFKWATDSVKYPGIIVHRDKDAVIRLNYGPARTNFKHRSNIGYVYLYPWWVDSPS